MLQLAWPSPILRELRVSCFIFILSAFGRRTMSAFCWGLVHIDYGVFHFNNRWKQLVIFHPCDVHVFLPFEHPVSKSFHHHILFNIVLLRCSMCIKLASSLTKLSFSTWLTIQPMALLFLLLLAIFSIALQIWLRLTHPSMIDFSHFIYTPCIDPLGIHLLRCAHDSECPRTSMPGTTWSGNNCMFFYFLHLEHLGQHCLHPWKCCHC
jgi:hypothetical protein